MAKPTDILEEAKKYLNMHDEPLGSHNIQFNTDYYGCEVSGPDYPWCCAFVWDIFRMAGASDVFMGGEKTAYCQDVWEWYKLRGKTGGKPRQGALVIYNWKGYGDADHIGIVVRDNGDGSITTIEGNTSDSSHSDGGYVLYRVRDSGIVGFCYPEYEDEKPDKILRYGDVGKAVKEMQELLLACGFWCGTCRADSEFGSGTLQGLKAFQRTNGLECDGEYGPASRTKLEAVWRARQERFSVTQRLPLLQKGSRGEAVKIWQILIHEEHADGIFGEHTEEKTIAFQKGHGITDAPHVVGAAAWEMAIAAL